MIVKKIRYGDFQSETSVQQRYLSYNNLSPKLETDENGREIPYRPEKLELRNKDIYRLIAPYVSIRLVGQIKAVVPLALYLVIFQLVILRQSVLGHWMITAGLVAVIVGLMIFMEGIKLGLMPFGELIGHGLPKKSSLGVVLFVAFLLGIVVTFAEPAIGALQAVGSIVDVERAPYLYAMLNDWSGTLVLFVGIGVGMAAVLGTLRFLNGWSLKPMVYFSLIPALGLTLYLFTNEEAAKTIGLAWDSGAVTTGPITVPLVLSLGIGIAAAGGKGNSSLSGFGIVTLASLFPVIAVMLLSVYISSTVSPEEIVSAAQSAAMAGGEPAWYAKTPAVEIINGIRAIVPLVLFLFIVLKLVLHEKISEAGVVAYGLSLSLIGMMIFNLGLSYGLAKLGGQSGSLVPSAFAQLENVEGSPLYAYSIGISIAFIFAWILGFGATQAEPALNALGMTVENLTNGAFKKSTMIYAVSIGVGFGIALGVIKIIYDIQIVYLIIPGYIIAVILTALSSEEFVNVAWDSAGVTTGPVTVPLVLAMGIGFGDAVNAVEGFGILSMASIGPVLSVLLTGLIVQWRIKRVEKESARQEAAGAAPL